MKLLSLFFMCMFLISVTVAAKDEVVPNSTKPAEGKKEMELKYSWEAEKMIVQNPMLNSGMYNGEIFFLQNEQVRYNLVFTDLQGKVKKTLTFPRGKGPGEVFQSMGVKVINDTIYFADSAMKKVSMFDIKGKYIDEIMIMDEIGFVFTFDILDNYIYFTDLVANRIIQVDLKTGRIVKKEAFSKPNDLQSNDALTITALKADYSEKKIWLCNLEYPYQVQKKNKDISTIMTITKKLSGSYDPLKMKPQQGMVGDFMFSSLLTDRNYFYAPFGFSENNKERDYSVFVFDKIEGKFVYELTTKKVKTVYNGSMYLIGADQKHLVFMLNESGNAIKELFPNKPNVKAAILVFDNPVY